MDTVRRDWIKRQIIAGKVMIETNMILTDDYAFDAAYNCQKSNWRKADIKHFSEQDFKYTSGYAYWENKAEGIISWTMLCNHYYTIKILKDE